jgi:hypothetical protein
VSTATFLGWALAYLVWYTLLTPVILNFISIYEEILNIFFFSMSSRVFATILGIAETTSSSKTALSPAVMKFRYEAVLEALVAAAANNSFDFSVLLGSSYQNSFNV